MKKILIILVVLFLTGCNSYNDINNIAVVSSIGIDIQNENYKVYVKVLSSNQESKSDLYESICSNLDECFDDINNKLMKRLYLTHLDLLILSNNLVKENYDHVFDFFLNQKSSRNAFSTIIIKDFDKKIFEYDTKDINNMLDLSINTTGLSKIITLDNIVKDILNYKLSYIPFLEINDHLEIKGYKTIYDENKILSSKESISINFIKNNINNISLIIEENNYKLESCNSLINLKNDKLNINIGCKYKGEEIKNTQIIKEFLYNSINNFIKDNSDNYLKYIYYKFNGNKKDILDYDINIDIKYTEDFGGGIFE